MLEVDGANESFCSRSLQVSLVHRRFWLATCASATREHPSLYPDLVAGSGVARGHAPAVFPFYTRAIRTTSARSVGSGIRCDAGFVYDAVTLEPPEVRRIKDLRSERT